MFTDPSFSTPQGGDLKGVNSPNPRPPPFAAFAGGSAGGPAGGGAFTFARPLLVALAGFLPKTGPKPPQSQGNQAKPPARHSTTATTTTRLARSPGAAPTRSPRWTQQGHHSSTSANRGSHSNYYSRISWETA